MSELFKRVSEILLSVSKPVRYIGNEYNAVHKDHKDVDVSFALAFPDVYEIGMSHLGIRILYHLLNDREDVVCERVFVNSFSRNNIINVKKCIPFQTNIDKCCLHTWQNIYDFPFIYISGNPTVRIPLNIQFNKNPIFQTGCSGLKTIYIDDNLPRHNLFHLPNILKQAV
jgi:hypothetical protein